MVERRRFRWGFVALGVFAVALVFWATLGHKPAASAKGASKSAVAVTVAQAAYQDVPISLSELGSALAWQAVTVRSQVNGKLMRVPVAEGTDVKKGQLLAEIDDAPFRAVLIQAQGALARDRALLKEAQANLARFQTLAAQNSIARQQVEDQAALVLQDEGTVKVDEGAVAAAQVNVNYCHIVSPVSGRVGVRMVDPGNLVSTSDTTGIVIVNQITPIGVTFTVPQGDFQTLVNLSGGFSRSLPVEALSQETGASLGLGEVRIADNRVDPATGTVQLKARFENAGKRLWPGQFVNVRIRLQTLTQAVVIPATAVNQGPKGPFAYVVGPDNKATVRPIVVGATQDATAVIKSGLKVGETVVTDGQMVLKPGSLVAIHAQAPAKKSAS